MKTWVSCGIDSHKRETIWFESSEEIPIGEREFIHGEWEYLCDGVLSAQESDRFMVMHRTVCDLN